MTALRKMRFLAASLVVVGLTTASGLLHGVATHRWGDSQELIEAAKRIKQLPKRIGPWRERDSEDLSAEAQRILECSGFVVRTYENASNGKDVKVAIIAGPPGPTAVHTPDICYSSQDYAIVQGPETIQRASEGDRLRPSYWRTVFEAKDLAATKLHVWHAWNDGSGWVASKNPRIEFGNRPFLYKIQVASQESLGVATDAADSCVAFLDDLAALDFHWAPDPTDSSQ